MKPKKPVTLDEFMEPQKSLFGKALDVYTWPTRTAAKGAWKGLGVLAWPFERAQGFTAGPSKAVLETGWPVNALTSLTGALGVEKDKMGLAEGAGHIAKSFGPPIKSLVRWKMHPEAATWPEVYAEYNRKMVGPEWAKEKYPFPMYPWKKEISAEGLATSAGMGTSFLTDPAVVSGAFKGLTRLGKAVPWYKAYQATKLPKLADLMLEHGADRAENIEKARQLGKTVSSKALKPIAKRLFDTKKPTKSQISAVAKRLKQIEQGGVTTDPQLAEKAGGFADFWAKNRPILEKARLLGKETIFTKLTKAQKAFKKNEITKLEGQIAKLQKAPYQDTLEKLAKGLRIKGQRTAANRVVRLTDQLKNASPDQQQKIIDEIVHIGESVQKQGLTGLRPLLKRVTSMKRRFPGQADKIGQLQDKIDDIKLQIYRSEHLGGTLPSGESIPLKYAPRMYASKEQATRRWPFFSKFRIRKPYAKHRKDIPLAVRKEMGELTGIGYPEVKRSMQIGNDLATAQLFENIARTPGWVDDMAEGFKELKSSTGAYGILEGRKVHPTVYNQVRAVVDVRTNPGKFHDALVGTWKQFKLMSLALLGRNKVSNFFLNDITGTDPIDQARMVPKAIKHFKARDLEWQTAKRYLSRSGFQEAELMDDLLNVSQGGKPSGFLDAFSRFTGYLRKYTGTEAFGRAYGKTEFFDKYIKYLHMREKGMVPLEAVKEANRTLFDYGALHPLEKSIARRIMPFYTFPRKAIPVVLQSMRDNPHAVAKWPIAFWGAHQYSLNKLNMTNEDYEELAEQLPEYLDRNSVLLMPYRDENGKLRLYDWTYSLPWGPMAEFTQQGPDRYIISNPIFTFFADTGRNLNAFTGKPIYDDSQGKLFFPYVQYAAYTPQSMTPAWKREQLYKIFKYSWQMAMPPYTPDVVPGGIDTGGIYWDKLDEAFYQKTRPIRETLLHTGLGFRTQAIDPNETKMWHYKGTSKQIESLSGQLWSLSYKKAQGKITQEEYDRQKQIILDQMKHTADTNLLLKTTR